MSILQKCTFKSLYMTPQNQAVERLNPNEHSTQSHWPADPHAFAAAEYPATCP